MNLNIKKLLFLYILILFNIIFFYKNVLANDFETNIQKIDELYKNNDLINALNKLEELKNSHDIKKNIKNYVKILVYLARLKSELDPNFNINEIQKLIDDNITQIKDKQFLKNMYVALATIYFNNNKLNEAKKIIQKALEIEKSVELFLTSAIISTKLNNKEETYKILDKAFEACKKYNDTSELFIMSNTVAILVAFYFDDFLYIQNHINKLINIILKIKISNELVKTYYLLEGNLFSYFENHILAFIFYEKIFKILKNYNLTNELGEIALKLSSILVELKIYNKSIKFLDEAINYLKIDEELKSLNEKSDIELIKFNNVINKIINILIKCNLYTHANSLLEKLITLNKKLKLQNFKFEFEQIRLLILCKFKQKDNIWKSLSDDLILTCKELNDTKELLLTLNLVGELLYETNEVYEAEKIFKNIISNFENHNFEIEKNLSLFEIYFKASYNLILVYEKLNKPELINSIINELIKKYDKFQKLKIALNKMQKIESLTHFKITLELHTFEVQKIIGKTYLIYAKVLFKDKKFNEAFEKLNLSFELLKNFEVDYLNEIFNLVTLYKNTSINSTNYEKITKFQQNYKQMLELVDNILKEY